MKREEYGVVIERLKEVNATHLEPQEVLSDHAYYYRKGVWISL